MTTDSEKPIVPPSQTTNGNEPDPELGSSVLGQTTGSDEPATESGVDSSAGDHADAITSRGADFPDDEGVEPSNGAAAMDPMKAVRDYAASKAV